MSNISYSIQTYCEETPQQTLQFFYTVQEQSLKKSFQEIQIPLEIFASDLSPARCIVKYLIDHQVLDIKTISKMLNRKYRSIWLINQKSKTQKLHLSNKGISVPLDYLLIPDLSLLESLIYSLKKQYSFVQIARLLYRDQRMIWCVYHNALKKKGETRA